jgi:diguanylate cyclase (GGDEF)-like protein
VSRPARSAPAPSSSPAADRRHAARRAGLDGLGSAVLEALPGLAALLDASGALCAVNGVWRRHTGPADRVSVDLAMGRNSATDIRRSAVAYPPDIGRTLIDVADAIDDVVAGRRARASVSIDHLPGWAAYGVVTIAAVPDPPGGALVTIAPRDEQEAMIGRLAIENTHDSLTALPNRALFLDRVTHALARPGRRAVSLLYLDIDRFRLVNAVSGPAVGDEVLTAVARRVARLLTTGESAARLGDDSFAIVSEVVDGDAGALALAARLQARLAEPIPVLGRDVVVSGSIGVAVAAPGTVTTADDLLRDAELATRQAKEQGGSRAVLAHQAMHLASIQRMEIEQALRGALDRDELWLEFQPEVSLESGGVVGAEALLRWSHPELGGLGPSEFIWIAEEIGAIHQIGAWVLRQACRLAAAWELPSESDNFYVAVNVSGHQLADPSLVDQVQLVLRESGLPAGRLCLEVTESVMLGNLTAARQALTELRALGVRIALDDFGTGYASFEYLLRLPIDLVKLDASFIAHLASDPQDRAMVEAMVGLSRRLGLQLVAEGVEDESQHAVLAALGCDVVQGYRTGRPGDEAALLGTVWRRAWGVRE